VMGERVPEGGGSNGEAGPMLVQSTGGEEVGARRSEVAGGSVLVREVREV